jgi:hypothetical protein
LRTWGVDADPFARGLAEKVEDAELAREPLSKPGQIIRVKRGTDAERTANKDNDGPLDPVRWQCRVHGLRAIHIASD